MILQESAQKQQYRSRYCTQTFAGKISAEECHRLLDSFDNNKTPGNDGIPIEFCKIFWPAISDSFMDCINEISKKVRSLALKNKQSSHLLKRKGKIVHF